MGAPEIRSAEDMSDLLRAACPETAAGFARAEHAKARAGWDEGREAFWQRVVELLAGPAAETPAPPMPPQPAPRRPPAGDGAAWPARCERLPHNVVRLARR